MFHIRHQPFYRASVPQFREPWIITSADTVNGWTLLQVQQINSAANLLASALEHEHELVLLLRNGLPILPGTPPTEQRRTGITPAWYHDGKMYVIPEMTPYLFLLSQVIAHELLHVKSGHDISGYPPGLNRLLTRCEWEISTHQGELAICTAIQQYLKSTPQFDSDHCRIWIDELEWNRQSAECQITFYAMRKVIIDLVQKLVEVAHHDSSVVDPRQSQVFVFAQQLSNIYVSQQPEPTAVIAALPSIRSKIDWFGIPSSLPQQPLIASCLEMWKRLCSKLIEQQALIQSADIYWQHLRFQ